MSETLNGKEQSQGTSGGTNPQQSTSRGTNPQQSTPEFDYDKLANIISGKQTVTEDTVLKNYFRQQGLSQEEMQSAISAFKAEKAKNTPDATALQEQLKETNQELLESRLNYQATFEAMTLGLDPKTIPYVVKLADMGKAVDEQGNVNAEEVKKALTQVLTDVPAFKGTNTSEEQNKEGGFQVGQSQQNNESNQDDILRNIFGIRK